MQYAIVDIETTGGSARGSRITEIAIIIHDGKQIIERWESLVNPNQHIPPAIFALTGITNEMVADAPYFHDLAPTILALLSDRVFVAHNVNFDYSFIKHQLEELGHRWSPAKLCTVRMARTIRPGYLSYSLGRLCDALNIPISNRHRAGGDADATALLFERLIAWDTEGTISQMLRRSSPLQRLPPHLPQAEFESLPGTAGVYYFHDRTGKVIYVGKAVNLKKRVASHFTGHDISARRQQFMKEIHHLSYEICATELMALLLECVEIKRLWPKYNRALKKFEPKFGLFTYQGINGYEYLAVGKLTKQQPCFQLFQSEYEAVSALRKLCTDYDIDMRYCRFGTVSEKEFTTNRFQHAISSEEHNHRIAEALSALAEAQPSFYIIDRGRTPQERSCIWVEKGQFYGMGYLHEDNQLHDQEDIRQSLKRYPGNDYMMHLIRQFTERHPERVTPCVGPQH